MEVFCNQTKIVSGRGVLESLREFDARRALIVADPFFHENGVAGQVAAATGATETEVFHHVLPDPTVKLAAEGTAALRRFEPELVVALGGGSAMDLAKAMVYFSGTKAPLAAIPTTSGSGSEVTDFAILTHETVKHPLVDPRLRPRMAILDGALLDQLPPSLVADGGFDVLCHALEAFVATDAGAVTDALAKEAFCTAFAALPASFAGRTQVRLRIHNAATMAGLAFTQAGLGMCHAIAHSLGGAFHVPHGRLNAVLLPAVISCNAHGAAEKYAKLARAAGLGGTADAIAVRNLKNSLIRLRRELKLPQTLSQAGIDPRALWQQMDGIVQAALDDPCCRTNPLPVEDFMVRRVLEEVAGSV